MAIAKTVYNGINTSAIYIADTAYGTPGTFVGTSYIDKVTSYTVTLTNNVQLYQGIGEGRDANTYVNGRFDVTGSVEAILTDPAFLQYCVIGTVAGAGTAGSPYLITEVDQIGFDTGMVPTIGMKLSSEGGSNDQSVQVDGAAIQNWSLTMAKDDVAKFTFDFVARYAQSSTTVEAYTRPTNKPMGFMEGSLTIGASDIVGELQSFSLQSANNLGIYGNVGTRFISMPVAGTRRYNFTITVKYHFDSTASVMSATELRSLVLGSTSATAPVTTATQAPQDLTLAFSEGSSSGNRNMQFLFENAIFESVSIPVAFEDAPIEATYSGYILAGKTASSVKKPIKWWTV